MEDVLESQRRTQGVHEKFLSSSFLSAHSRRHNSGSSTQGTLDQFKFQDDMYVNITISLQDVLHRAENFITMDEDKKTNLLKQVAMKQVATKLAVTYQEPRKHSYNKLDKIKTSSILSLRMRVLTQLL